MKWPKFGKPAYQAPQVAAVPKGQSGDQNGTYINDEGRMFVVKLFDGGRPEDLAVALGTLDIAKDIVKQRMTAWHMKDAQRRSIVVPSNGNGGMHVR